MTLKFQDYRNLLLAACLIALLLAALPAVSVLVTFPKGGEKFSELWLLAPNHMAENYPFNITIGQSYTVYLGVGNHMGSSAYHAIYIKFRNQTQPLPNATASVPSPLPILYEIRFFATDGGTWEKLVTFSVSETSRLGATSSVSRLTINDRSTRTNSSTAWNPDRHGFYYQLFFELWIYDVATQDLKFHNRFVGIWLNITN